MTSHIPFPGINDLFPQFLTVLPAFHCRPASGIAVAMQVAQLKDTLPS